MISEIELLPERIRETIPAHRLLTILTSEKTTLNRFQKSDSLSKLYIHEVLREKGNLKFEEGDVVGALSVYNLVLSIGVFFICKNRKSRNKDGEICKRIQK